MIIKIKFDNFDEATKFVKLCNEFDMDIDCKFGRYTVDAKSIIGICSIGLDKRIIVEPITDDKEQINKFAAKLKELEEKLNDKC